MAGGRKKKHRDSGSKAEGRKAADAGGEPEELSRKDFESALEKLQVELVKLQLWVQEEKKKIIVIFEGRDAAGKGGVIKRITERVSPRVFRIAALPAPTEREKTQWYFQRYVPYLPAGGEIVLFDRSLVQPRRRRTRHGVCRAR